MNQAVLKTAIRIFRYQQSVGARLDMKHQSQTVKGRTNKSKDARVCAQGRESISDYVVRIRLSARNSRLGLVTCDVFRLNNCKLQSLIHSARKRRSKWGGRGVGMVHFTEIGLSPSQLSNTGSPQ